MFGSMDRIAGRLTIGCGVGDVISGDVDLSCVPGNK